MDEAQEISATTLKEAQEVEPIYCVNNGENKGLFCVSKKLKTTESEKDSDFIRVARRLEDEPRVVDQIVLLNL